MSCLLSFQGNFASEKNLPRTRLFRCLSRNLDCTSLQNRACCNLKKRRTGRRIQSSRQFPNFPARDQLIEISTLPPIADVDYDDIITRDNSVSIKDFSIINVDSTLSFGDQSQSQGSSSKGSFGDQSQSQGSGLSSSSKGSFGDQNQSQGSSSKESFGDQNQSQGSGLSSSSKGPFGDQSESQGSSLSSSSKGFKRVEDNSIDVGDSSKSKPSDLQVSDQMFFFCNVCFFLTQPVFTGGPEQGSMRAQFTL